MLIHFKKIHSYYYTKSYKCSIVITNTTDFYISMLIHFMKIHSYYYTKSHKYSVVITNRTDCSVILFTWTGILSLEVDELSLLIPATVSSVLYLGFSVISVK